MNRENYLELIASFMISLVLTIPLITSANASIESITVKGNDGIEGFARSSDFLDFSVAVSLENVTPAKIFLGTQIKFDKCATSASNGTVCTLKYPKTGRQSFEARPLPFTINLFRDENKTQLVSSETGSVLVDNKAPEAKLSIAKQLYSGQENIVANYEANEFSCNDTECSGKCTGFKTIEIRSGDNSFKQSINPNTTDCSVKSSISIEAKKLKEGSNNSLLITATDKFNQISSEQSVSFSIDLTPPKILPETFKIMRKGIILNAYSDKDVPVEVFIDVQASDLAPDSVVADFSPLNPTKDLKNLKGACVPARSDVFRCKWLIDINSGTAADQNAETEPSTPVDSSQRTTSAAAAASRTSSKSINITASDKIGNTASASVSKSLLLDDKGPVVQSLAAGMEKDGKFYSKPAGNTVTVIFTEATYMLAEDVFLYVNEERIGNPSCRKDSNWVCKWQNVNFGSDKINLSIRQDTVDLLLNPVTDTKSLGIIVDTKAPALKGAISIVPQGSLTDKYPDLIKVGDKLLAEANVTEDNDLFAFADFSKFIDNARNVAGSCQRLEDKSYKCNWATDALAKSGTDFIRFNFSDFVGNALFEKRQIKVLSLDEAAAPDYWTHSVKCSPQAIDRQLGPFINQRAYCSVKLQPQPNIFAPQILSITPAACTGSKVVQAYETFNNEIGSTSPIIKFIIKQEQLNLDFDEIKCSFSIISRSGDKITKNPEIETVNITLKFYNQPLGEISEAVEDEITKTKKEIDGIWKKIGTWNKIVNYAKKICQFINIIYLAATAIYTAAIALHIIKAATSGTPAGPATAAAATKVCYSSEESSEWADDFKKGTDKFCDYITCKQTILWGPAAKKWINSAPLAGYIGPKEDGQGSYYDPTKERFYGTRPLSEYMDPRNNIVTAFTFACIPGIITGLEKFRQIRCLYVDCLQSAVAQDGLSITACKNLRGHAECKYLWGEIFAVIPYTAFFDHFTGIVKDALSNPFTALGIAASVFCKPQCGIEKVDAGAGYAACRGFRVFSLLGDTAENVKNLVNEGFKIRQDYCTRLDSQEEKNDEEDNQQSNSGTRSDTRTNPQQGTRG